MSKERTEEKEETSGMRTIAKRTVIVPAEEDLEQKLKFFNQTFNQSYVANGYIDYAVHLYFSNVIF